MIDRVLSESCPESIGVYDASRALGSSGWVGASVSC